MAPSISGTSGTLTHGSSVTISGTGFGSKGGTNANKPLIWADFESSINPTSLGHYTAWDGTQNLTRNVGGTQYGNSGANVIGTRATGVQAFAFQLVHTFSSKLYASGKRRWSAFNTSANYKYFRLWNDAPSSFLATNLSDGTCYDESYTTQADRFQGVQPSANVWRAEEFLWRKGTTTPSGDPITADGYWQMIVNGTTQQLLNGTLCSNLTANYGQGLGLEVFDNFDTNEDLANGTNIWMDDLYIDDTWARVIVGNASTLASCTTREVQIPSSWSDTSINVTLNRGAFGPTDTAYLYVFDSSNVASAGQAITFGGGGQTVSPAFAAMVASLFAPTVTASQPPAASGVLLFL